MSKEGNVVIEQRIKAFTRWVNSELKRRSMKVTDLSKDFQDGVKLINLYELVSGESLPRYSKNPRTQFQKVNNLSIVLKPLNTFISEYDLKLQYSPQMLESGGINAALDVIWLLIMKCILRGMNLNLLLEWAYEKTGIRGSCEYLDPKVIVALIDHMQENGIYSPFREMTRQSSDELLKDNFTRPFKDVESMFGIPQIFDPKELIDAYKQSKIDAKSMTLYLGLFYRWFSESAPKDDGTKRTIHPKHLPSSEKKEEEIMKTDDDEKKSTFPPKKKSEECRSLLTEQITKEKMEVLKNLNMLKSFVRILVSSISGKKNEREKKLVLDHLTEDIDWKNLIFLFFQKNRLIESSMSIFRVYRQIRSLDGMIGSTWMNSLENQICLLLHQIKLSDNKNKRLLCQLFLECFKIYEERHIASSSSSSASKKKEEEDFFDTFEEEKHLKTKFCSTIMSIMKKAEKSRSLFAYLRQLSRKSDTGSKILDTHFEIIVPGEFEYNGLPEVNELEKKLLNPKRGESSSYTTEFMGEDGDSENSIIGYKEVLVLLSDHFCRFFENVNDELKKDDEEENEETEGEDDEEEEEVEEKVEYDLSKAGGYCTVNGSSVMKSSGGGWNCLVRVKLHRKTTKDDWIKKYEKLIVHVDHSNRDKSGLMFNIINPSCAASQYSQWGNYPVKGGTYIFEFFNDTGKVTKTFGSNVEEKIITPDHAYLGIFMYYSQNQVTVTRFIKRKKKKVAKIVKKKKSPKSPVPSVFTIKGLHSSHSIDCFIEYCLTKQISSEKTRNLSDILDLLTFSISQYDRIDGRKKNIFGLTKVLLEEIIPSRFSDDKELLIEEIKECYGKLCFDISDGKSHVVIDELKKIWMKVVKDERELEKILAKSKKNYEKKRMLMDLKNEIREVREENKRMKLEMEEMKKRILVLEGKKT